MYFLTILSEASYYAEHLLTSVLLILEFINTGNKEFKWTIFIFIFILILDIGLELAYTIQLRLLWGIYPNVNYNGTLPHATLLI